jgi:hypothetical protein
MKKSSIEVVWTIYALLRILVHLEVSSGCSNDQKFLLGTNLKLRIRHDKVCMCE